jgi:hypothetical protein
MAESRAVTSCLKPSTSVTILQTISGHKKAPSCLL